MSQPLHLKYRPQRLVDLVGQNLIRDCLTVALSQNQIAPAYLFYGPRGTGKTSTARILAKSLNCLKSEGPTATPCGECGTCRSIANGSALDVIEIDAASHGGVEDARELVQSSQLSPAQSRYKVVILDECHMLTPQAQNALLKVIEEPPLRVVFILATTEPHKVLPTISSRCLTFEFRPLSAKALKAYLSRIAQAEGIAITGDGIEAMAKLCQGGLRDALQLLAKVALLDSDEVDGPQVYAMTGQVSGHQVLPVLESVLGRAVQELLQRARTLIETGHTPMELHLALLAVYHDLMLVKQTPKAESLLSGPLSPSQLEPLAASLSLEQIYQSLEVLGESERQLRLSPNPQPWLEVVLMKLMPETAITPHPLPSDALSCTEVWEQVLAQAQPKAQGILKRYCQLSHLDVDRGKATLMVDQRRQTTLMKHKAKVAALLEQVLGQPVRLKLQITDPVGV